MVAWVGAGSFSGLTYTAGNGRTQLADVPGVLGIAGVRDTNIITRVQGANSVTPTQITAKVTFKYEIGDEDYWNNLGPAGAWAWSCAMFVTPDYSLAYPPNGRPTVAAIMAASTAQVYRGKITSASGGTTLSFTIAGPSNIRSMGKYWAAVVPTYSRDGATGYPSDPQSRPPSFTNDKILIPGTEETLGRAVSFWTNRPPGKPTITSPPHRTVVSPGTAFTVKTTIPDPDAINTLDEPRSGIIGAQIQYARQPRTPEDTPEWMNMPVGVFNRIDPGWVIQGTAYKVPGFGSNEPYGANGLLDPTVGLRVMAGRSVQPSAEPIAAIPPGDWQIRVRTFDQGNPASFARGGVRPQDSVARQYVPSESGAGPNQTVYPSYNTSPWSDPVYVSIPARVPPPIAVSPIDGVAVPVNKPVVLRWRYRNSATTENTQKALRVEIRKIGDPLWTPVFSNLASTPYVTLNPSEVDGGYTQSPLPDFGFENGTLGGFSTFGYPAGTSVTLSNVQGSDPVAAQGERMLLATQTGPNPASGTFGITSAVVPVKPGIKAAALRGVIYGPVGGGGVNLGVTLTFYDANMNVVVGTSPGAISLTQGRWNWFNLGYALTTDAQRNSVRFVRSQIVVMSGATGSISGYRFDALTLDMEPWPDAGQSVHNYPFVSGNEYEWRVLVSDTSNSYSFYSDPARFWVVAAPGSGGVRPVPTETVDGATLGCGKHRAFIYRRGGKVRVGEITDISVLDWNRVRDDISTAKVEVRGWGPDCGNLLKKLQSWAYELVLFRDNGYSVDRVWEGPITLLTYERDRVTIHAKDLMAIPYRRIIKQKLSDAGVGSTVVDRAVRVLQNALAPDDPNILPYLTPLDDMNQSAKQYRTTPAYSRTAFEEIDDMASNAGLDYTVVGRSILLWGTKQRIGTLPEFRDEDLGSPPIVSEYGMSMANVYAVADGNGLYGEANRLNSEGKDPTYGLVEMLSSTWASDSATDTGSYTEEGLETIRESFKEFSERSIADRYPPPMVVRIPANTTLNPDAVVSIQHLVPGVVIPLRSYGTLRTVVADQKLDSVVVTEEGGRETINITVSPFSRDDAAGETEVLE